MKYYETLLEKKCFTFKDVEFMVGGNRNRNTAKSLLRQYTQKGFVQQVKKNLYVAISIETGMPMASNYQIASNITPSSYVSHHSAFMYYGYTNQVSYEMNVSSDNLFSNFEYDGIDYVHISSRIPLNRVNQFPHDETCRTFLVDAKNQVLAVGDPLTNPKIKHLFTEILSKKMAKTAQITRIGTNMSELSVGDVTQGDVIERQLVITNYGDTPFVLADLTTSCDCTTASLSDKQILPHKTAILTIRIKTDDTTGQFMRSVDIFGNIAQSLNIEVNGTIVPMSN